MFFGITGPVLLLLGVGCIPRSMNAQLIPPLPTERAEAILVLQHSDLPVDAPVFLREDLVDAVAAGLRAIRAQYPPVRTIGSGNDETRLYLNLTDSVVQTLAARFPAAWVGDTLVAATGFRAIDSVNTRLGARSVRIRRSGPSSLRWTISPVFNRPIITWLMAQRYAGVSGVSWAGPPSYLGGSDQISVREVGGLLYFDFSHGWGDCESGCINQHTWQFRYHPRTGAACARGEVGPPLPAPPPNVTLQQAERPRSHC